MNEKQGEKMEIKREFWEKEQGEREIEGRKRKRRDRKKGREKGRQ